MERRGLADRMGPAGMYRVQQLQETSRRGRGSRSPAQERISCPTQATADCRLRFFGPTHRSNIEPCQSAGASVEGAMVTAQAQEPALLLELQPDAPQTPSLGRLPSDSRYCVSSVPMRSGEVSRQISHSNAEAPRQPMVW